MASIPSPPFDRLEIGPLTLRAYGLMYALAIFAAIAITTRRWKAGGGRSELVQEVALWAVPAGLIGGRLYHVITSWNELPDAWWGPFAIWEGGMGVIGGIALGTLAGVMVLRRRGADVSAFMDAGAPALLVAQAIGRLGNWFNQELFGRPTDLPWAVEIDPDQRPGRYRDFATFHPTFLYELLWNLALAGALVVIGRRRRIRPPGLFALYVAGYGAFRIVEELFLRIDPSHELLGLRLNLFVAAGLFVAGVAAFAWTQRAAATHR